MYASPVVKNVEGLKTTRNLGASSSAMSGRPLSKIEKGIGMWYEARLLVVEVPTIVDKAACFACGTRVSPSMYRFSP